LLAGVYDKPISSLDIMATITALTGAPVNAANPLDGVNLIPYLTGKNSGAPHDTIYLRKFDDKQYAVRNGDHKLIIQFENAKPQLYNLDTDIGEENNIATQHPKKLQHLDDLRVKWDSELIDPRFEGLIHLPRWQEKIKKKKQADRKKFDAMDKDADGRVTEAEWLKSSRADAKKKNQPYDKSSQKKEFAECDIDVDGAITIDEFELSTWNK